MTLVSGVTTQQHGQLAALNPPTHYDLCSPCATAFHVWIKPAAEAPPATS